MKNLSSVGPKFLSGLLVLVLFYGCQKSDFEKSANLSSGSQNIVTAGTKAANFMVISKTEALPSGFESTISAYGQVLKSIPEIGVLVVKPTATNFKSKVSKLADVLAVVPDLKVRWIEPLTVVEETNPPSIGDDETYFPYLWGLDAINAPEAWNAGYKGAGARVFILDSGIDAEHPDIQPNLNTELSTSFVPGEGYNIRPGAYFNHGTHVAGIIAAADNSYGVIGVAPEAEIVAVKVLSEYSGSGDFSWVDEGIVYAADNGADVINMSLGAVVNRNGFYIDENGDLQRDQPATIQFLIIAQQRALNYAARKGVVIISSAGNDGTDFDGLGAYVKLPADLQHVVAVSATAPDYWYYYLSNGIEDVNFDIPASYTSYGKSLVDLAAPGGDFDFQGNPGYQFDMVLSASSQSFYFAAGTSMAAPHVAGVAALIIGKNGGQMNPDDVIQQLYRTADNIDGMGVTDFFGRGRVNAYRAVNEE
jgi:subtilisin family serine protease